MPNSGIYSPFTGKLVKWFHCVCPNPGFIDGVQRYHMKPPTMALHQLVTNETDQKRLTDIPLLAEYLKENEPPKNGAFIVSRIIEPATYDNYTIVIGDDLARCNVYPSNPVYAYLADNLEALRSRADAMYVVLTNRKKGFWALSTDDEQECKWSEDKLGYLIGKPKKRPKTPASTANLADNASTATEVSA